MGSVKAHKERVSAAPSLRSSRHTTSGVLVSQVSQCQTERILEMKKDTGLSHGPFTFARHHYPGNIDGYRIADKDGNCMGVSYAKNNAVQIVNALNEDGENVVAVTKIAEQYAHKYTVSIVSFCVFAFICVVTALMFYVHK